MTADQAMPTSVKKRKKKAELGRADTGGAHFSSVPLSSVTNNSVRSSASRTVLVVLVASDKYFRDMNILRPETFDVAPGSPRASAKWSEWIESFESFIEVIEMEENYKLDILTSHVSPLVYSFISDCESYQSAISVLSDVYCGVKNEVLGRYKLITRKQRPGETVDSYLLALKNLGKDCCFESVSAEKNCEAYIRDAFIAGLQSPFIRKKLLESENLTLDKIYEKAKFFELLKTSHSSLLLTNGLEKPKLKEEGCDLPNHDPIKCLNSLLGIEKHNFEFEATHKSENSSKTEIESRSPLSNFIEYLIDVYMNKKECDPSDHIPEKYDSRNQDNESLEVVGETTEPQIRSPDDEQTSTIEIQNSDINSELFIDNDFQDDCVDSRTCESNEWSRESVCDSVATEFDSSESLESPWDSRESSLAPDNAPMSVEDKESSTSTRVVTADSSQTAVRRKKKVFREVRIPNTMRNINKIKEYNTIIFLHFAGSFVNKHVQIISIYNTWVFEWRYY